MIDRQIAKAHPNAVRLGGVCTQLDALVADEDGRPGNELAHLVLALAQNER